MNNAVHKLTLCVDSQPLPRVPYVNTLTCDQLYGKVVERECGVSKKSRDENDVVAVHKKIFQYLRHIHAVGRTPSLLNSLFKSAVRLSIVGR